jgi:heat shock protein HslJ
MMRLLIVLAAFAVAACTTTDAPTPAPSTSYLNGTSWRRVDDMNANPHGATMAFSADRASGDTQCNRWFATVRHDGESIQFGEIGLTRRACTSQVSQGTERSFLEALRATRYAHYDQDALVLLDAQQQVIARFDRE